jgi:hypothetical protein
VLAAGWRRDGSVPPPDASLVALNLTLREKIASADKACTLFVLKEMNVA